MENQNKKTEKEVLSMVHDIIAAGHAEELQDIILDAFAESLQDQHQGRIKALKNQLQDIADIVEATFSTTIIDGVTYPFYQEEEDKVKIEIIGNMLF